MFSLCGIFVLACCPDSPLDWCFPSCLRLSWCAFYSFAEVLGHWNSSRAQRDGSKSKFQRSIFFRHLSAPPLEYLRLGSGRARGIYNDEQQQQQKSSCSPRTYISLEVINKCVDTWSNGRWWSLWWRKWWEASQVTTWARALQERGNSRWKIPWGLKASRVSQQRTIWLEQRVQGAEW